MERTVSRRAFVGSVAAGIPLVAGSAGHALANSSTGPRHIHRGDGTADAMFEHATRQLAAMVNRVGRNGATTEDARLAALHFSTLAVYARQAGLDAHTKKAMRALVQAKGRDAVLDLEIDRQRLQAELQKYGVDVDERWIPAHTIDRGIRAHVFEDLSRDGVTKTLASLAATFEHVAGELERRASRPSGVRLIQGGDSWRIEFCAQLWLNVSVQSAHAAMLCAAMMFMPGMESQCAFAQMSVLYFAAIYNAMCF
jgi:hypothetical protein